MAALPGAPLTETSAGGAADSPWRVLRIYLATTRVLASYLWLRAQRPFLSRLRYEQRLLGRHSRNARRIERAIVSAGGLFIKVGQMISILSNFLPEEFRREFEGLQDKLPPRPYAEVAARIEAEFGASPDDLFSTFDRVPIATASLAQVHAATLADGRAVAVKAQHADIERVARLDLRLIRRLLQLVQYFTGVRGIEAYHPEISQMIAEELDFTAEARNIVRIAAFFDGDPAVGFPTVIAERSTARVLTTEFVQGTKITDFAGLAAAGLDRRMLAERVVRAYCRMIFVEGVYHADPHPGNILVAADGSIVFIDFGAVGVLSPTMRAGVAAFVEGVLQRDVGRISEAMRTMGFVARDARSEDVARRVVDYMQQRFLDQLATGAWNLGDIQMDLGTKLEMIGDLRKLDLSFRQITASFQVPKDWVLLERTLLLLVGLCTELDPSWNPMTVIRPYLEDAVLGHDRDWTEILRGAVKDWVLRAATLPEGLQQLLTRANGGELVVRVPEITVASRLLYAAAHQLLYGLLGTAACVLAYQANDRGRAFLTWSLSAAAVVCFVSLLVSLSTTKRLTD